MSKIKTREIRENTRRKVTKQLEGRLQEIISKVDPLMRENEGLRIKLTDALRENRCLSQKNKDLQDELETQKTLNALLLGGGVDSFENLVQEIKGIKSINISYGSDF